MTVTVTSGTAQHALERGVQRLLALQHPDGWWKGELETNVTIDAEDLFLRHHLGLLEPKLGQLVTHAVAPGATRSVGKHGDGMRVVDATGAALRPADEAPGRV